MSKKKKLGRKPMYKGKTAVYSRRVPIKLMKQIDAAVIEIIEPFKILR